MSMERQTFQKWQWLSFAVIALLNLLVYSQSFLHIARSDQVNYLAEVAHLQDWFSLAIQSYDLNRHRVFAPGDELLFRPVVYFILGTEKYLFGYHFLYWQIAAILCHLWVIWSLLKLLLTIRRSIFAVFFTAFFSLLYINMEMVIWHHISSYMVFTALILTVLYHVYVYSTKEGGNGQAWRLWVIMVCLSISAFTYEAGIIYAVLIFLFFWLSRPNDPQRKKFLILWIPVICYLAASVSNFYLTGVQSPEGQKILTSSNFMGRIIDFLVTGIWFLYAGIFASQLELVCGVRHMVSEKVALLQALNLSDVTVLGSFVLVLFYILILGRTLTKDFLRKQGKFLLLLIVMMAIYTLAIAFGREHSRGLRLILARNLYYPYQFWALAMVCLYAAVDFKQLTRSPLLLRLLRGAGIVLLSLLIIVNGVRTYQMVEKQAQATNPVLILMRTLELLIKEHGKEPDFSFFVDVRYPGNFILPELTKRGDPPEKRYNFIELIYPQYYSYRNPKYAFIPAL